MKKILKTAKNTFCILLVACLLTAIASSAYCRVLPGNYETTRATLPEESIVPTDIAIVPPENTEAPTNPPEETQTPTSPTESKPATTPPEATEHIHTKPIPTEPVPTDPHATETEETEPATYPSKEESLYPKKYSDDTCDITIYREWYENAWCYIAHIQFSDYARFGTSCANGKYNNGYETTSHAANRLNAILTVNGCYSAPKLNYTVVRSGELCNGSDKNMYCPAVYSNQNGLLLSAWEVGGTPGIVGANVDSLVADGLVTDTFCFGPPILVDGEVTVGSGGSRAQRTFIGTNGQPGDLWIVVSEGRYKDGISAGLTGNQCARLLAEKGCTFVVPLDGGGSSTMVFLGEVLNTVTKERSVVDFVYFK